MSRQAKGRLALVVAVGLLAIGLGSSEGRVAVIILGVGITGILLIGALSGGKAAPLDNVDEFAGLSGIETTEASRHFIAYYLLTGRRLRAVLVLAAVFLPALVGQALGLTDQFEVPASWQAVLAACLVGTVWAELALTRPAGKVRVASLRPRDIGTYLGQPLLWSPVIASGIAAAMWAGVPALPAVSDGGVERASRGEIVTGLVFAVAVPAVVALTQRWIVTRPQPFSIPSLVAADDAIRAASVRYLAAVGTAMALINLAGGGFQYTVVWNGAADVVFGGASFASLILAWFYWNARKPGRLMRSSRELRPFSVPAA